MEDIDWVENFLSVLEEFDLKCFLYERDKPAGSSTTQTLKGLFYFYSILQFVKILSNNVNNFNYFETFLYKIRYVV